MDLIAIQHAELHFSVSNLNAEEIVRVLSLRLSSVAYGHIFPTQTGDMPSRPQDIENFPC
ncbi:thiamine phosphate synthase [Aggregatibacter actinomycetemcomitans]|nr:thiamine phosphate synthase [Aggregatibacter actinomycetemcomitans]MBN6071162.1 thiamine phosphate synthase [Aggregatibacter actinomycetemcomitans]